MDILALSDEIHPHNSLGLLAGHYRVSYSVCGALTMVIDDVPTRHARLPRGRYASVGRVTISHLGAARVSSLVPCTAKSTTD